MKCKILPSIFSSIIQQFKSCSESNLTSILNLKEKSRPVRVFIIVNLKLNLTTTNLNLGMTIQIKTQLKKCQKIQLMKVILVKKILITSHYTS